MTEGWAANPKDNATDTRGTQRSTLAQLQAHPGTQAGTCPQLAPPARHWEALEHGAPRAQPHSGWEHRAAELPLPLPAPHGPLPLPRGGDASIGGRASALPDFGTPLWHINPHQRGLCMLETPWCTLPAHLTTATGHNPLLPSQCLMREKALWCVPAGLRNAWEQWKVEQRFSVLASPEAPWPWHWGGGHLPAAPLPRVPHIPVEQQQLRPSQG